MIIQVVVIVLVCLAASLLVLAIAGLSLSVFGRFLKRTEQAGEEHRP